MDKISGITLTLITGLFFLVGGLIANRAKDKDKLNSFSVALAFVIICSLVIFDLGPEVFDLLSKYIDSLKMCIIVVFTLIGIIILSILDMYIPDHYHQHYDDEDENVEEHNLHLKHIGILTILSLALHNALEGFTIYGMAQNNFKIGLLVSVSVALHNIPLGTHIFSTMDMKKHKLLTGGLTLTSVLGGVIFLLVGEVNNLVLSMITSLTLGMMIYIALGELLPEIFVNKKKKETIYGLLAGLGIAVISIFI